jgi:hypothetical protein
VVDREGNKIHPSLVYVEGRNEGGAFLGIFLDINVTTKVLAEADLYDDEGALLPVERSRVWGGSVWTSLA